MGPHPWSKIVSRVSAQRFREAGWWITLGRNWSKKSRENNGATGTGGSVRPHLSAAVAATFGLGGSNITCIRRPPHLGHLKRCPKDRAERLLQSMRLRAGRSRCVLGVSLACRSLAWCRPFAWCPLDGAPGRLPPTRTDQASAFRHVSQHESRHPDAHQAFESDEPSQHGTAHQRHCRQNQFPCVHDLHSGSRGATRTGRIRFRLRGL
jgi:hypothetical protein